MALSDTVADIDHLTDEQRDCIEHCQEAVEVGEWCADRCLGDETMEECARLCRDVADLASLHARLLARDSASGRRIAEACEEACEACADQCERHDDRHCQVAEPVLRECAASCRSVLAV